MKNQAVSREVTMWAALGKPFTCLSFFPSLFNLLLQMYGYLSVKHLMDIEMSQKSVVYESFLH